MKQFLFDFCRAYFSFFLAFFIVLFFCYLCNAFILWDLTPFELSTKWGRTKFLLYLICSLIVAKKIDNE